MSNSPDNRQNSLFVAFPGKLLAEDLAEVIAGIDIGNAHLLARREVRGKCASRHRSYRLYLRSEITIAPTRC